MTLGKMTWVKWLKYDTSSYTFGIYDYSHIL